MNPKAKEVMWMKRWRSCESQKKKKCHLLGGGDTDVANMNSQQLWMPVLGLEKNELINS